MARKSSDRTSRKSNARGSRDDKKKSSQRDSSRASSSYRGANEGKVVSISQGRKQSSAPGRSSGGRSSSVSPTPRAQALTDHDEIRRWAEERGAHPSCVRDPSDQEDVGMIRLDSPGHSGEGSLEEIGWDEWFDKFDESGLALLVQKHTAHSEKSNFNKLVRRETVESMAESAGRRSHKKRPA